MRTFTVWREWTERWLVPFQVQAPTAEEALVTALRFPIARPGAPAQIVDQEAWVSTPAGAEVLSSDQCHARVVAAARSVA